MELVLQFSSHTAGGRKNPCQPLGGHFRNRAMSQSLTVSSPKIPPAVARVFPSLLNAVHQRLIASVLMATRVVLAAVSHSLTVPSALAEIRVLPSGDRATERTSWVCPLRVARSLPVSTSHSLTA